MTNKNQDPSVSSEEWVAVDVILKVSNAKEMTQLLLSVHAAILKVQSENIELMEADIVVIDPDTYLPRYEHDDNVKPNVMYSTQDPKIFYSVDGFYTI